MDLPVLIETDTLFSRLSDDLLIIDCCSAESYAQGHIQGAVHVAPSQLSCGTKPATGKLPSLKNLQSLFESIGLTAQSRVVVYDDAGGSWAGRLIWTLDLIDHQQSSMLNGGIKAWVNDSFPLETTAAEIQTSRLNLNIDQTLIADIDEILQQLDNPDTAIWDVRTTEEHNGTKVLGQRGGHIPGAIHHEWTELTNANDSDRIRPLGVIQDELDAKGLSKNKTIITHCQTHRRSGLTYFVAKKLLGYDNIKAYPGSWSEWGNREDAPIEK